MAILAGSPYLVSSVLASVLLVVWKLADRRVGLSWGHAVFPLMWAITSAVVLRATTVLLPLTLDRYLYAADASFGFQPAFAGARLLLGHPWLLRVCELCYYNLPVAMTVLYLVLLRRSGVRAANEYAKFAIALGVAGTALYFACPAAGPWAMLPADFPARAPALPMEWVAVPEVARNCMPSLHTAWVLCLMWSAPRLGRAARTALCAYAGFTLLYTLSGGGHYLVDLIVAVPFTLAVRSGLRREWRSGAFAVNAGAVAFWLVLLRLNVAWSPAFTYGLTAITLAPGILAVAARAERRPAMAASHS